MIARLGNSATAIAAAFINVLVLFDAVEWSNEQIAGVNLLAGLIIAVIFGVTSGIITGTAD